MFKVTLNKISMVQIICEFSDCYLQTVYAKPNLQFGLAWFTESPSHHFTSIKLKIFSTGALFLYLYENVLCGFDSTTK